MGPESYTNKFSFRPFLNLKLEIEILDEIKMSTQNRLTGAAAVDAPKL